MINPRSWNPMPPPPSASGFIEALVNEPTQRVVQDVLLFQYSDGTSKWGNYTETHGKKTVAHPEYEGWRFTGPTVPDIQGSIVVWEWWGAPGELRSLSNFGGDEDWLALLPNEDVPLWMEGGTPFASCKLRVYPLGDGRFVAIGTHS